MGRDPHSLVLRQDGTVYHNNEEKNRLPANSLPQEGDIVVRISGNSVNVKLIWDLLLVNKSICVCFHSGLNLGFAAYILALPSCILRVNGVIDFYAPKSASIHPS